MLIGFIGAPASGKTTVAAMLFGKIKSEGYYVSDLLTERARRYIIHRKFKTGGDISLTDDDQHQIYWEQLREELIYKKTLPIKDIIISDSCIINNYLYLKRVSEDKRLAFSNAIREYDIIFYCRQSDSQYHEDDIGRLHSRSESQDIDAQIPELLSSFGIEAVDLIGRPQVRLETAYKTVMTYIQTYGPGL